MPFGGEQICPTHKSVQLMNFVLTNELDWSSLKYAGKAGRRKGAEARDLRGDSFAVRLFFNNQQGRPLILWS